MNTDNVEQAWAEVIAIEPAMMVVRLLSEDQSCGTASCGAAGVGCQTNAFARLLARQPALRLPLPVEKVTVADKLCLQISYPTLLRLSLMGYLLPLLALLLGIVIGQWLSGDGGALIIGVLAMSVAWWTLGRWTVKVSPQIVQIIRATS